MNNTYNTTTELKDAIQEVMHNYLKDGKKLGVYSMSKISNDGTFLELAQTWGNDFAISVKRFNGKNVELIKRIYSDTKVTAKEARLLIA